MVVMIALSAAVARWESLQRLFDPQPLDNIGWVIAAAIVDPHPRRSQRLRRRTCGVIRA